MKAGVFHGLQHIAFQAATAGRIIADDDDDEVIRSRAQAPQQWFHLGEESTAKCVDSHGLQCQKGKFCPFGEKKHLKEHFTWYCLTHPKLWSEVLCRSPPA